VKKSPLAKYGLENVMVFEGFPQKDKCPICGTNDDVACILVGVDGTNTHGDGDIEEALPVHVRCLCDYKLARINQNVGVVYFKFKYRVTAGQHD
jgi:hypothetical protein